MSDEAIPELRKHADIWETASRIAIAPKAEGALFSEQYIAPIARAILAERERAAQLAEAEELTGAPPPHLTLHEIDLVKASVRATAKSIASSIRSSL